MSHIITTEEREDALPEDGENYPFEFGFANALKIVGESAKRTYGINPYAKTEGELETDANNAYQDSVVKNF